MQSTSSRSRNPETWHIAHTYQYKKCGHFQRIIIACVWDSCNGVEEGSCLLSSGMLKVYTDCKVAALLVHDGVTERGVASMKTWVYSEDWDISVLLYRRERTVLEEGEKGGPYAVRNGPDSLALVWEAGRACVNNCQFMMFWSKKDCPLRKSNLCLCMYMLCLGEYGWSRAALNVELWTPELQFYF